MAIIQREPLEELTHWEPFRGIEHLQREMNRLFDRLMPSGNGEIRSLSFVPSAEMEETDDTIHLRLEVPGMEAKDLTVEITDDSISIKGERKSESKTEDKGMIRSEFRYGHFERRLPLSVSIHADKARAECKNGVLTLTLPKAESGKRKAVQVSVN